MIETESLRLIIAVILAVLGVICFIAGLRVIFASEYRNTMKDLAIQSAKVSRRGVTEQGIAPIIDATSKLIDSVSSLVRTAFGMGAFLCLLGLALILAAAFVLGVLA